MQSDLPNAPVHVFNPEGRSSVVLVCEHASRYIPAEFGDLGLGDTARQSHIAWDPGALGVAQGVAKHLNAKLVYSTVSRLVYDCNRPPSAPAAMPERSETTDISGNANLTPGQRDDRAARYYEPFRECLAETISATPDPVIVTIHSFTPIFDRQPRAVEIGVLHDNDARLANVMMQHAEAHSDMQVEINEPYGPQDGVTHTLKEHALDAGYLNVMLEIRNDLIETERQQQDVADRLCSWLLEALAALDVSVSAP